MTLTRVLTTSSVLALLAGPALADLTAEDVLADQLAQIALYGLDAQANGQSRSGDVLTVESLTATASIPEEDASVELTIGGAMFTEQGDGSVIITYPNEIPISVTVSIPDEDDISISMDLNQSDMQTVVSGTPQQFRYEFTGSSISLDDIEIDIPDESVTFDMGIAVDMTGLLGVMNITAGEIRPYDIDVTADAIKLAMDMSVPEESMNFNILYDIKSLAAVYSGTLARQNIMDSFAQSIANGNTTSGTFQHGQATYDIDMNLPDADFDADATVASGSYAFSMDESGIDYSGQYNNMNLTVGLGSMGLPPMNFTMAEAGGRLQMPVVPGEDPQDFALVTTLVDMEIDPFVWSMIDPAEQLPRDPATIIIDTTGEVVLTEDIFAADYGQGPITAPPGQINALAINEIKVSLAGAELTGDGDLTFNNQFGIPMPIGVVNVMLKGGNTLLDTLVAMNLIPEEQAMGARMMTGMFARPGDGPDTLVSTIEMKEDGSILANGQRIK